MGSPDRRERTQALAWLRDARRLGGICPGARVSHAHRREQACGDSGGGLCGTGTGNGL